MFENVAEMLSYPFMVRAFLVGSLVALCSALLGVSLVLKRYSMIGDGLSHVGFGALAIAAAANTAPLAAAIPIVILAAVLLLRISSNTKMKGDAAIAMISTGSLAVGVMVISMTTGMNTDVYNYMFGSILAMSSEDVKLSVVLSAAVLILYVFFYQKIFAVTFDETFARATGVRTNLYNTMIAVLTAVTIVLGMRMMGALLVSDVYKRQMKVGEFVHVIADAHIYDRHIPMIEELIAREPLPAPTFWLNPEIKDFYAFTPEDVRLEGYETHQQIKNIPVAV